jgi:hypothetical protein
MSNTNGRVAKVQETFRNIKEGSQQFMMDIRLKDSAKEMEADLIILGLEVAGISLQEYLTIKEKFSRTRPSGIV